jgi:hypothetical protein
MKKSWIVIAIAVVVVLILMGFVFVLFMPFPSDPDIVDLNEETCNVAGGHWNECGSKCSIKNAGNPGAVCVQVCEPLCECGGIAGFRCPRGYNCIMPTGVADALGYCAANG